MNYEAILNQNKNDFNYFNFCKIYYKYEDKKIKDMQKEKIKKIFPFWNNPNPKDKKYKNVSLKDFSLTWLKNQQREISIDLSNIKNISNIDLETYTKTLIPNSFALQVDFTLKSPYYSSDDDEFYIINNPCLKEKVFKVPMVRGSSIKGALIDSAREIIKNKSANSDKVKALESYFRIFGVGDNEFREVVKELNDNNIKLFFMLNGLAIDVNSDVKNIFKKYKESKAQKGRAIFYPIYFDKLSLEIINPHNRKTKAGTNPIHYEVVPKGSNSQLQIVYIPYDGILGKDSDIQKEAKQDLKFLKKCIQKAFYNGIGAKTKLGWGKANINGNIRKFWSKR